MILEFATSFSRYNESVHDGDWAKAKQFSYFNFPITELSDKTLGIYGFGNIGMKIIAYSKSEKSSSFVDFVSQKEIFKSSDFLTLHCPLNDETNGIINSSNLSLMKNSAYLINTCRGGVIVEEDLVEALNNGLISGAGIDVLAVEPMKVNHPYLEAKNCLITPHVGWAALETRKRLVSLVAKNIKEFSLGNPINIVN